MNTTTPEAPSLAARVDAAMIASLFTREELVDGQPPADAVRVEGIVRGFALHPGRLEAQRAEVRSILDAVLIPGFYRQSGGGQSFLQLPLTKTGELWCEHDRAEALYALAAGLGLARFCIEKSFWPMLPGGVPYLVFDLEASTAPSAP